MMIFKSYIGYRIYLGHTTEPSKTDTVGGGPVAIDQVSKLQGSSFLDTS